MDRHELKKERLALRRSRDLYAEAFEAARDDYYTGINAAAKSVLLDTPQDLARAAAYAAQVLEIVGSRRTPGDYWRTATSAEALLIGKDYRQAGELYQASVDMAPAEIGSHELTWGQARRLMEKLGPNEEERLLVARAFSHLAGA